MLHLSEGGHDREQHRPHRCHRIDVAAAQDQYPQARTATAKLLSEREQVLRRSTQSVQGRDDESVAVPECVDGSVELGPGRSRTANPVINVKVILANPGSKDVNLLPVGGLLAGGDPRVADQLRHFSSEGVA